MATALRTNGSHFTRKLPVLGSSPAKSASETTDVNTTIDVEAELRAYEEAEQERLGLKKARKQWVDSMLAPEMKKSERANVTLLIGGLTAAQDFLVEGAVRGLGYNVEMLSVPDNAGLQVGKEFGNRGQCNPTYFTVGNLVKHLIELRDVKGIPTQDIIKNFVFLTAGACGPCRFGMYVTEYRKALRDAGFDGFRVMLFQQQGGLSQATGDDVGIELSPPFFVAVVKAIVCGDVINALGYRIRPYEVTPGSADKALEEAKKLLYSALHHKTNIFVALWKAHNVLKSVPVDRLRVRPKVSIIGEFWAMTTEGDGNYQLQRFLEKEHGECDIQLTTAWLLYNIWEVYRDTKERRYLRDADGGKYGLKDFDELGVGKRLATLRLAEWGLRLGFQAFAIPAGLYDYHLPDMDLVAEVAHQYYNNDLRGGEGHMEVGKLIVNTVMSKAHITVSVKPFGCMPSSGVSDGVQSLITARYPGTIYCAVETSGDGAANFYSRVQMYMFKARQAAQQELDRACQENNVTIEQVQAFLAKHPKYNSALHKPAHHYAGTAANLVREVAPFITKSALERTKDRASSVMKKLSSVVSALPTVAKKTVETVRSSEFQSRVREDVALLKDLTHGKIQENFKPIIERLAHRAVFDKDPVNTQPTPAVQQSATVYASAVN